MLAYDIKNGDVDSSPVVSIQLTEISETETTVINKLKELMAIQFSMNNCEARLNELVTEYDTNSISYVLTQIITIDPEMYQDIITFIQNLIMRKKNRNDLDILEYMNTLDYYKKLENLDKDEETDEDQEEEKE